MDALRDRLKNRIALRRAWPADKVSPEAIQRFWSGLSRSERLSVLRFDDPAVVQQTDSHMKALCLLELQQRKTSAARELDWQPERLSGFRFECSADVDCIGRMSPAALCATPDFVKADDILEYLKQQLGSDFLAGRPALHRSDWSNVVATSPKTWHELRLQVLRLVELALFQAEMDAPKMELSDGEEDTNQVSKKARKPRNKKKKQAAARSVEIDKSDAVRTLEVNEDELFMESALTTSGCVISGSRATEKSTQDDGASSSSSSWSAWLPSLLRAAPCVTVDSEAVQHFWYGLSFEQRLEVLRLEDRVIVQRMHDHMNSLYNHELRQSRTLATSSDESPERLPGFRFQFIQAEASCMGCGVIPIALCATPEFVASENIFEVLEETLGSWFLVGRPVIAPQDWKSIVKTTPKSWHELQQQAFRIVELALLHAQQKALQDGTKCKSWQVESDTLEKIPEEVCFGDNPPSPSAAKRNQNKKARTRRKKQTSAPNTSAELDLSPGDRQLELEKMPDAELMQNALSLGLDASDVAKMLADGARNLLIRIIMDAGAGVVDNDDDQNLSMREEACVRDGISEPIPKHNANEGIDGQSWRAWIPYFYENQWAWMLSGQQASQEGIRAVVKNTFLDIDVEPLRQLVVRRRVSRSCRF